MACRGVHFAVEADTVKLLLDAKSDSAVLDIVQEDIERKWNEEWLHQYTWNWFQGLPDLFDRAARAGRAVIFTVDQ